MCFKAFPSILTVGIIIRPSSTHILLSAIVLTMLYRQYDIYALPRSLRLYALFRVQLLSIFKVLYTAVKRCRSRD